MAKRVRNADLETKTARGKLARQAKPHYQSIGPGVHLGYRKNKGAGKWVIRLYKEAEGGGPGTYVVKTVAAADDTNDADGVIIMDYWQAQKEALSRAREKAGRVEQRSGPYCVEDAINDYLQWMAASGKDADDTRYRTEALIIPQLGNIKVENLTSKRMRSWLTDVAATPPRIRTKSGDAARYGEIDNSEDAVRKRRNSANRVLTILKAALNHAFSEGRVLSDLEWRRVKPFENVEQPRVRYLTVAEAQRLINACNPDFRPLVQAALQTGCRYGELGRMRVADFNPDNGTVHVQRSKTGEGRHVVLTEEGADIFNRLSAGRPGDGLLFQKANGTAWGKSHQNRPMIAACSRAGIAPQIGFHQLRHTWASLSVMNGVPLLVVADNLGHKDTRMLELHYGHMSRGYIADEIRKGAPRFGIEPSNVTRLASQGA